MIRHVSKVFVTRIHAPANNLCRIPCVSLEVFVLIRSVSAKSEIRLQLDDGTGRSSPDGVESSETVRALEMSKTCWTRQLNTESGNLQIEMRAWSEFGSRQDLLSNVLWTQDFGSRALQVSLTNQQNRLTW